ncbi:MAG: glutamate-cysteine ligase family protein [Candidatus Caenarcaniphilales bacterium]|nr:glutamate-cysteine ligase family protein [Candidatus Caenarcaniphilales bacterium]
MTLQVYSLIDSQQRILLSHSQQKIPQIKKYFHSQKETYRFRAGLEVERPLIQKTNGGLIYIPAGVNIAKALGHATEPDAHTSEYASPPFLDLEALIRNIGSTYLTSRGFLRDKGIDYGAGSTIMLPEPIFIRTDPKNPYHSFIEKYFGTTVRTASIHINNSVIGLPVSERLNKLTEIADFLRLEAALYLGLSSSSPFHDGKSTGWQSFRTKLFPSYPNPEGIPFFSNHAEYIDWFGYLPNKYLRGLSSAFSNLRPKDETHISRTLELFNEQGFPQAAQKAARLLWTSARLNGPRRPDQVDRVELRICDLPNDLTVAVALTALVQLRTNQLLQNPDMINIPRGLEDQRQLAQICRENELAVAEHGLDAEIKLPAHRDFKDKTTTPRKFLEGLFGDQETQTLIKQMGHQRWIQRLERVLTEGNDASRMITQFEELISQGKSEIEAIETVLRTAMQETEQFDRNLIGLN